MGVGRVRLEPLQLTANFRSDRAIVEWNNQAFATAFPGSPDAMIAAVPLTPSVAARAGHDALPVQVHPFVCFPEIRNDYEAEAALVVELVKQAQSGDPLGTTAILFRARTHAPAIARALRDAEILFQAVEMNSLADSMCVQDLLSLTRALVHPADRLSWLAILRAPWCGLALPDLTAIGERDRHATVWDLLQRGDVLAALTGDGRKRVERFLRPLANVLTNRSRLPLRVAVESTWYALGGPATLASTAELSDAEAFLEVLEEFDHAGDLINFDLLSERITKLFSQPNPNASASVQMLTMHKAKGLQFDTVIVPGLGRKRQRDADKLLSWLEYGESLLLSPVRTPGHEKESLAVFLDWVAAQRLDLEEARLLYVAATRARRRLHLIGQVNVELDRSGQFRLADPGSDTLLKHLWPTVAATFHDKFAAELKQRSASVSPVPPREHHHLLYRLPSSWKAPPSPEPVQSATSDSETGFRWTGDTLRYIGTTVHKSFERIALSGIESWDAQRLRNSVPRWRTELLSLGVPTEELQDAVASVHRIVQETLAQQRGRWLLSPHQHAACEYALSGVARGELRRVKIDRTFVDEEGTRWMIDYKTAECPDVDVERFLDDESRVYREQLQRYASVLARLDPEHPIRIGLYFPLVAGWREWSFDELAVGAAP
jgi:ATP-dependent exoDNAse (exonuclease V) beta subunit